MVKTGQIRHTKGLDKLGRHVFGDCKPHKDF